MNSKTIIWPMFVAIMIVCMIVLAFCIINCVKGAMAFAGFVMQKTIVYIV